MIRVRLLVCLVLVVSLSGCGVVSVLREVTSPYLPRPLGSSFVKPPTPPAGDRPVALLVMSGLGTEVTDLLGPQEILAASEAFDVRVVAPGLGPTATNFALAVMPDTSYADAPPADLLVVPAVLDPENPELLRFVREQAREARLVLSICEGARVLAAAGLLDGRRATTHFFALAGLQAAHPQVEFIAGRRYVADGPIVSSAGVTAGLDATLHAIELIAGSAAAERARSALGYQWLREDRPESAAPGDSRFHLSLFGIVAFGLHAALDPFPERVGVLVYPGVSGLGVAAALDTFPRTLRAHAVSVSQQRVPIRTRYGVWLLADRALDEVADLERLVVPSGRPVEGTAPANLAPAGVALHDLSARPSGEAVLDQLQLLHTLVGPHLTGVVATQLEQPFPRRP